MRITSCQDIELRWLLAGCIASALERQQLMRLRTKSRALLVPRGVQVPDQVATAASSARMPQVNISIDLPKLAWLQNGQKVADEKAVTNVSRVQNTILKRMTPVGEHVENVRRELESCGKSVEGLLCAPWGHVLWDGTSCNFFTDYGGEDVQNFLKTRKASYDDVLDFCCQIPDILDALTAANLVHGDIKHSNLVRDNLARYRLIDFDYSHQQSISKSTGGALSYQAPEKLKEQKSTPETDVWAMAMCVLFMVDDRLSGVVSKFIGGEMFSHKHPLVMLETEHSFFNSEGHRVSGMMLLGLIQGMLAKDPALRLTSSQIRLRTDVIRVIRNQEIALQKTDLHPEWMYDPTREM
ncbi:MAG: uncharacterized protein KVP18_000458 [Porospora cf. gigantea A]|uniref:uncharacterized protein n=2 Tax=Porospora cf. gigantea A TaxID=2853593 RepID=UPI00355A34C0|nr:MAG: hypothetical protein KVP18_000458 [Porospora cf. gigantea A]